MDNRRVQLTKDALKALQTELHELNDIKRPKLVERLSYAMSQGDLSENADYTNAKEELEFLDGRISELTAVVNNAVLVNNQTKNGKVGIGTKVTVKIAGKSQIFTIVGEWEADPANKKISPSSPLGKVLMDKSRGEKVIVEAPAGRITYEILAIS